MKIVINIEKKHLVFFSLFILLVGSIFAFADLPPETSSNPGHSAAELGTGTMYGLLEINSGGESCGTDNTYGAALTISGSNCANGLEVEGDIALNWHNITQVTQIKPQYLTLTGNPSSGDVPYNSFFLSESHELKYKNNDGNTFLVNLE